MANVVTHPHLQVDFPSKPPNPFASALSFGFGFSNSSTAGWPSSSVQLPQTPFLPPTIQTSQPRINKRRIESEEDTDVPHKHARDDAMDRSPTPERPKRAAPKRARTTPAITNVKDRDNSKENKPPAQSDGNDVDVGVLLGAFCLSHFRKTNVHSCITASLPSQSLLPLLTSLLSAQPSLKPTVLSLIPRPTLETAVNALANAAKKLQDAYPYSNSLFSHSPSQFAPNEPSSSFGFGSHANRTLPTPSMSFGFGRPSPISFNSAPQPTAGGMREEYILSRLTPHIADFVSACLSYLPYFSYVAAPSNSSSSKPEASTTAQSHASALRSQHRDASHPSETYLFLAALIGHVLSQPPLTRSSLVPLILPRLVEEWKAWVDRVDELVNRQGGMFGQETVRSWERGLEEFAQSKGDGLEVMREIRDVWVSKVGWLVGRQHLMEEGL